MTIFAACCPLVQAAQCADLAASLSTSQRAKFSLASALCSAADAPAGRMQPADALIATEPKSLETAARIPEPVSRHLELFDTKRTVLVPPVAAGADPAGAGLHTAQAVAGTARVAQSPKPRPALAAVRRALQLAPDVDEVARRHDIDPLLLHAIAHVESRHDPGATSPAGARGVMQVMPATAQRFGVASAQALGQARTNIEVSAAYLKTLQRRFGNDLTLVLAAYNAGEGAVERHGRRVPPYAETQSYVRQVLAHYRLLSDVAGRRSGGPRTDL